MKIKNVLIFPIGNDIGNELIKSLIYIKDIIPIFAGYDQKF